MPPDDGVCVKIYFVTNKKTGAQHNYEGGITGNGVVKWKNTGIEWPVEDVVYPWREMQEDNDAKRNK